MNDKCEAIAWLGNIKEKYIHGGDEEFDECRRESIDMAIKALRQQQIVRCKDCVYWQDNNEGYPHEYCKWREDETPDSDDYCSAGERKEGR